MMTSVAMATVSAAQLDEWWCIVATSPVVDRRHHLVMNMSYRPSLISAIKLSAEKFMNKVEQLHSIISISG